MVLGDNNSDMIFVSVLLVAIAVVVVISIVMTSVFASKKGANKSMKDEGDFLDKMVSSKSCVCAQAQAQTPPAGDAVVIAK
jgi:hypothetical protein